MYRKLFAAGLLSLALAACAEEKGPATEAVALTTYKSATCGCCKLWVKHARDNGFAVTAKDVDDLNGVKNRHGIEPRFQSCHTSVSREGYVFEGHIPARLVRRFLQSPPAGARGLAVPAMPPGSPGMEMGDRFVPYQVLQLNADGSHSVYAEIQSADQQY